MSAEAAGGERHAAPAWQSWGVISVCRLQEGVTAAWPGPGRMSLSAAAQSLSFQSWEERPKGSPNRELKSLLGQTGELKRQKASFAEKGGTGPSAN